MIVTIYKRPDGRTQELNITNVYEEDAKFFEDNQVRISMEELNNEFIIYGTHCDDVDGEYEQIVFSGGRTCQESLHELVGLMKDLVVK